MIRRTRAGLPILLAPLLCSSMTAHLAGQAQAPPGAAMTAHTLAAAVCTADRIGASIPTSAIGEPVGAVTLSAPVWVAGAEPESAYCQVDGTMAPATPGPTARAIHFSVVMPAAWKGRAVQLGGGGFNGVVPRLTGGRGAPIGPAQGVVTFGSDSGHQVPGPQGDTPDWTLNEEAIKNLGYLQMKKTRDAAMVIVERAYGAGPRYTYYVGTSQGGREALAVAQRYPRDYDGVAANVPIVSFSTLMLAPELVRIREKPAANAVPRAKINAIRAEFMRQCDGLDDLADGIVNNYMACRAIFDVTQGTPGRKPWAAKRCPGGVDPAPADDSASACLTDGQIGTLELVYSRYPYHAPLAHGERTFGMWVPTTDPGGSGLILDIRFRGQEGAAPDAPMHSHLGVLGVTGFLMQDLSANPLDYVEGGRFEARRQQLSAWLDANDPDLRAFAADGGKMIVAIGTDDTLASPGAQLDYYQALLDTMGLEAVDAFARLYVIPQANHGLMGRNAGVTGDGTPVPVAPIPSTFDRVQMLFDWVERGIAPPKSAVVTAGDRSLPLCSYPTYPRYVGGPASAAASYTCAMP
jgi:pimeloyl-ACP methyl ester carboxylesterase